MKKILLFLFISTQAFSQTDEKASKLADAVIKSMGGEKAYNNTRHIAWNFFGIRSLVWDKFTGDVRIDNVKDKSVYLVNVNSKTGKVMLKSQAVDAKPDSVQKLLKQAEEIWINDSYWLVMPFKLKDPGVTLKYLGTDKTTDGKETEVLEMTFTNVGVTPDNRYKIYIDPTTNLVVQWAYFKKYSDEKPLFTRPWGMYQQHGKILLSGERGDRDLTDIKVYDSLPASIYTSFEAPDFSQGKTPKLTK